MKFLILLVYYNRPKIVLNALNSIKNMNYSNWEMVFIDDGSEHPGEPVVREVLADYLDKITFIQTHDTVEQKMKQGGSRHGHFMNEAILNSDADVVIVLCDDDAIIPDYFTNLDRWFRNNRHKKYCYSHVRIFDPEKESPFFVEKRDHVTNVTGLINPCCTVDSSQIAYKRSCFTDGGMRYPSPMTRNLDAYMFDQLFKKYGPCHYTGFDSQYKGWFAGQLGSIKTPY